MLTVSTPPLSACVKAGTGSLRFIIATVERSSNEPGADELPRCSMRMRRGVSTVKRAMPSDETTTAEGSATGS